MPVADGSRQSGQQELLKDKSRYADQARNLYSNILATAKARESFSKHLSRIKPKDGVPVPNIYARLRAQELRVMAPGTHNIAQKEVKKVDDYYSAGSTWQKYPQTKNTSNCPLQMAHRAMSGNLPGELNKMINHHFCVVRKTNKRHKQGHSMADHLHHMRFLNVAEEVGEARRTFVASYKNVAAINCELANACKRQWDIVEKRREEQREKERRQRIRMLRETNFDEYVKLVRATKDNRLMELLDQTDSFLSIMGSRVEKQKKTVGGGVPVPSNEVAITTIKKKKGSANTAVVQKEYYDTTHIVKEKVIQPHSFQGSLMKYQLAGLEFLVSLYNNRLSGILADEMGLGKTVQTISLLLYLQEVKHNIGPHLIIVPLSTLPNWTEEFSKFAPSLKVFGYKGSQEERQLIARKIRKGNFNVVVTTFELILKDKKVLGGPKYRYVIVDEGHRMKNAKSKFHVTLSDKNFHSTHRLLLTGTPLQNNMTELWALLNFILPKIFTSSEDFQKWFEKPFGDVQDKNTKEALVLSEEEQFLVINRLHAVLRPFLLRRIKSEVLQDLPDKREYVVRMQLTPWQKCAYVQIRNKIKTGDMKKSLNNTFMQLRKLVNHPYLFTDEYYITKDVWRVSAKFEVLDRMLMKLVRTKHKCLIFCQMTQLMDILGDYLSLRGIKNHRLDGAINIDERKRRMDDFNDPASDTYVFALSTRAGGLGVNLQAADTVIIFDSDWNPHQDLQAQARAHRMGQKNEVRVFRFVSISPIEETVLQRSEAKLTMDAKVIQAGAFTAEGLDDVDNRESKLRAAIQGQDKMDGAMKKIKATTPEELNRYLARDEAEEAMFVLMDQNEFGIAKKPPPRLPANMINTRYNALSKIPGEDCIGLTNGDQDPTLLRLQIGDRCMSPVEIPKVWLVEKQVVEDLPEQPRRKGGTKRLNAVGYACLLSDEAYFRAHDRAATGEVTVEQALEDEYNARQVPKSGRGRGRKKQETASSSEDDNDAYISSGSEEKRPASGRGRGRKRVEPNKAGAISPKRPKKDVKASAGVSTPATSAGKGAEKASPKGKSTNRRKGGRRSTKT